MIVRNDRTSKIARGRVDNGCHWFAPIRNLARHADD